MCEFCNFEKKNIGKGLLDSQGRESYLRVTKFMGKFFLRYTGTHSKNNEAIINYCPMCGRKLSEVSGNERE